MGISDVLNESLINFINKQNKKNKGNQMKEEKLLKVNNDTPTFKKMEESLNELGKALESFNMVLDEFTLCTVSENPPEENLAIVSLAGVWRTSPEKIRDYTKTLYEHLDRLKNIFN